MPAAKFKRGGKTVTCPRASVLLPPPLHRLAKAKAKRGKISLSEYIARVLAADLDWQGANAA